MINLPVNVDKARLPAAYEHAKTMLAKCEKIDECKTWVDKAAALASYAKQAKDDSLLMHSRRIQSRAIRRAGELLKAIEPQNRGSSTMRSIVRGRDKAAREAGLDANRQAQATRIASISDAEFESAIESDAPPTPTALAARGTKKHTPKPPAKVPTVPHGFDPSEAIWQRAPKPPAQAPAVPYGFDPSEAALTAQGWLNRAGMAAQYARYAGAASCPKSKKMKTAVRDVIAAWSEILEFINTKQES
jgi:hypothetical protein